MATSALTASYCGHPEIAPWIEGVYVRAPNVNEKASYEKVEGPGCIYFWESCFWCKKTRVCTRGRKN